MTNSVDPDQMLHSVASDLGLHCFLRPVCPNYLGLLMNDNSSTDSKTKYGKCPKISYTNVSDKIAYANCAVPDQIAPSGAV